MGKVGKGWIRVGERSRAQIPSGQTQVYPCVNGALSTAEAPFCLLPAQPACPEHQPKREGVRLGVSCVSCCRALWGLDAYLPWDGQNGQLLHVGGPRGPGNLRGICFLLACLPQAREAAGWCGGTQQAVVDVGSEFWVLGDMVTDEGPAAGLRGSGSALGTSEGSFSAGSLVSFLSTQQRADDAL